MGHEGGDPERGGEGDAEHRRNESAAVGPEVPLADSDSDQRRSTDGGIPAKADETERSSDSGPEPDPEASARNAPQGGSTRDVSALVVGASERAQAVSYALGEHTVNVNPELDEDEFFRGFDGWPTVVDRYDLEKSVPDEKKRTFREVQRYWVNKPYAFVVIFHSEGENEKKYHVVEPSLPGIERDLRDFLSEKLRNAITYSWHEADDSPGIRARVIEEETYDLLSRYNMYTPTDIDDRRAGVVGSLIRSLGLSSGGGDQGDLRSDTAGDADTLAIQPTSRELGGLDGASARPERSILPPGETALTEYQVEKLLYYLRRDFIGYGRIDPIKHDVNVEDISCDGYESPVFVYHTEYEQLITNLAHGRESLDDFVVKLAQRSGKGISKRQPQVDASLPDGSRAQLTLGTEVSDRGTNYTIRQFKDVPFTPVDLINWHTFSLEQVALLWLCIENNKSIMFAGGTASGKTTSLNALSLFIPSTAKIVSIEDTREVELPQRNWVANVTRPSFTGDDTGDIDEFDLLEAALRQRPDYLVMGEVRGEEGRTLFQMMSTGHTTYTTFHADAVGEVIDRFTTDPINVSKSLFTALDLISIQTTTRVEGLKVRRNKTLTEINHYDAELDEINVQDIYRWHPATDEFKRMIKPSLLEEIKFDRGWDDERLDRELLERRVLLSYLVDRDIRSYAEVAAAIQGYISSPEAIMGLLARDQLSQALGDLRSLESVLIDIAPEKEEMVPRPDPRESVRQRAAEILADAGDSLLDAYSDVDVQEAAGRLRDVAQFDWNVDNAPAPTEAAVSPEGQERAVEEPGFDSPLDGVGEAED